MGPVPSTVWLYGGESGPSSGMGIDPLPETPYCIVLYETRVLQANHLLTLNNVIHTQTEWKTGRLTRRRLSEKRTKRMQGKEERRYKQ